MNVPQPREPDYHLSKNGIGVRVWENRDSYGIPFWFIHIGKSRWRPNFVEKYYAEEEESELMILVEMIRQVDSWIEVRRKVLLEETTKNSLYKAGKIP